MATVGFEVLTAATMRAPGSAYEELYLLEYKAVYSSTALDPRRWDFNIIINFEP
jgi:hypothetical protein